MVEDYSIELEVLDGEQDILAWRCINCGNIIEPVILRNRLATGTAISNARGQRLVLPESLPFSLGLCPGKVLDGFMDQDQADGGP
jgi:hypothetical protein